MSERVTTEVNTSYIVRTQAYGGTAYLSSRARRSPEGHKYYWVKNKRLATPMSYDAAQKCGLRYEGNVVRRTTVVSDQAV